MSPAWAIRSSCVSPVEVAVPVAVDVAVSAAGVVVAVAASESFPPQPAIVAASSIAPTRAGREPKRRNR
ncbi:MAG: hypothetical protein AMXMBFR23_16990 [Chloroflexota bacterium]